MRILITGGAGFIGSHTAQRLLCAGHNVRIIDDLNDFYAPALKRQNLAWVAEAGEFEIDYCDICDEIRINDIVSDCRPHAVIHLAARAGVRQSIAQPLLYERVNVRGTMVLLEACRRFGVSRLVFASSSSIYGDLGRVPFSEKDQVGTPVSPYAATKLAGEQICFTYSHLFELSVVALRFFTVYGPRQRPDLAIRHFVESIDRGAVINMFGDGTTARDFTYIEDIVNGVVAALHHPCTFEVFNLGSGRPQQLRNLICALEQCLGKRALINYLPQQPGDVPITFADVEKAGRLLGYEPKVAFERGIREYVDWHRDVLSSTAPPRSSVAISV